MIEFDNVSMTYNTGVQALKNVSFKVQDGEFVFVIGLSGSGKSTIIKLLNCEENPSAGKVLIDGYEISFLRKSLIPYLRRNIGMVFQDFRLIYSKTVYENVAFAMEIVGASPGLIKRRVPIVLSIVGLRDKANMRANQLSGGEQQRVAIARAMVNNPMLILADEPTGNLDPVNSEAIMALLEEINLSGATVIVCTHESGIVNKMHRRVIEISDGTLVRDEMLGEYNLESSSENQKRRGKKMKAHASSSKTARTAKGNARSVPFVRNINIKFGEDENSDEGFASAEKPAQEAAAKTPDIPGVPVALEEPAVSDETAPAKKSPKSDEEILSAVSLYYKKKVIDYRQPADVGKPVETALSPAPSPLGEEDVPETDGAVNFQNLIRPRRIEESTPREDRR